MLILALAIAIAAPQDSRACVAIDARLGPPADVIRSGVTVEDPFASITTRLFGYAGVSVVAGAVSGCGVTVDITGSFDEKETAVLHVSLTGRVRISRSAGSVIDREFKGTVVLLRPAQGAHFVRAQIDVLQVDGSFTDVLVSVLGEIFGSAPLLAALRDRLPAIRWSAARTLGALGAANAVEALIAASTDDNNTVRENAVVALGLIADPRALPALAAAVAAAENGTRSATAVDAIGRINSAEAIETLARLLGFRDWQAADAAAKHLAVRGDPRGCDHFAAGVRTTDSMRSARMGGYFEEIAASPALPPSCVDAFLAGLQTAHSNLPWNAAVALGLARDRRSADPLAAVMSSSRNSDLRVTAAHALARMGDRRWQAGILPALKEYESDPRFRGAAVTRRRAAEITGEFGDSTMLPSLEPLLRDVDADVRAAALAAIAQVKAR